MGSYIFFCKEINGTEESLANRHLFEKDFFGGEFQEQKIEYFRLRSMLDARENVSRNVIEGKKNALSLMLNLRDGNLPEYGIFDAVDQFLKWLDELDTNVFSLEHETILEYFEIMWEYYYGDESWFSNVSEFEILSIK